MKKILSLILVLFLAINFSGCFNEWFTNNVSDGNNEKPGNENEQQTPPPAVYSEGLRYEFAGGKYKVVNVGDCVDSDIIIPSTYQDKPVVAIAEEAFWGTTIKSIKIPSSITRIEKNAFSMCDSLESVVFEEKQGWMAKKEDTLPYGFDLELDNEVQNAVLLTSTYVNFIWVKV